MVITKVNISNRQSLNDLFSLWNKDICLYAIVDKKRKYIRRYIREMERYIWNNVK